MKYIEEMITMDKRKSNPPSWIVKNYEINSNVIKDYDVLKYREEFIKKLKKKKLDKAEFAKEIRSEMMYRYWSRTEYELIMKVTENGHIILSPWMGRRNSEEAEIDVTDDADFNWKGFSAEFYKKKGHKGEVKIDIWDQINYRLDDFVDYCWEYICGDKRKN